jgi:hypothetical protein
LSGPWQVGAVVLVAGWGWAVPRALWRLSAGRLSCPQGTETARAAAKINDRLELGGAPAGGLRNQAGWLAGLAAGPRSCRADPRAALFVLFWLRCSALVVLFCCVVLVVPFFSTLRCLPTYAGSLVSGGLGLGLALLGLSWVGWLGRSLAGGVASPICRLLGRLLLRIFRRFGSGGPLPC